MDFSDLPQWLQDSIPWFTVGTLVVVFLLSVWALGDKFKKTKHSEKEEDEE